MSKNYVYAIVEISYEYNDVVYHTTDDEAGKPIIVYSTIGRAKKECDILNLKFYRENELAYFSYADVVEGDRINDYLEMYNLKTFTFDYFTNYKTVIDEIEKIPDQSIKELIFSKFFYIKGYKVVQVELGGE